MPSKRGGNTVLGSGKHLQLVSEQGWEYVERVGVTGVVAIVAVTEDRRLILTDQFRRPVGRTVIDLPAGLVGDMTGQETEAAVEAAQRELLEETGYRAERMSFLAEGPTSPGLTSEVVTFLRATGLTKVAPGGGEGNESIHVHEVPLAEIEPWLKQATECASMIDLKVYTAVYFALTESL